MKCAPLALVLFVVASASATAPDVTFVSPCECQGFHGIHRWVAKTDLSPVPSDKSAIQSITPSQMYAWEGLGPDVDLAGMIEARLPSEEKWYALTQVRRLPIVNGENGKLVGMLSIDEVAQH